MREVERQAQSFDATRRFRGRGVGRPTMIIERASAMGEVVVREVERQAQDPDCRVSVGVQSNQAAIF